LLTSIQSIVSFLLEQIIVSCTTRRIEGWWIGPSVSHSLSTMCLVVSIWFNSPWEFFTCEKVLVFWFIAMEPSLFDSFWTVNSFSSWRIDSTKSEGDWGMWCLVWRGSVTLFVVVWRSSIDYEGSGKRRSNSSSPRSLTESDAVRLYSSNVIRSRYSWWSWWVGSSQTSCFCTTTEKIGKN